ncbi:DUF4132 domain-containing protein [Actinosynnema pretiosum]|uniref:DUF4132 domain-containing protein n=1 Tax=Actinosynnema pretiosum TaxID=42197 RepID=A0A290Z5X5_9PSEU|nr:DUF4132 domain-containing protein [Actinosynnema pretiosum]ATE54382.1 hypothetical protein CNX65_14670 [Actinosynnema pretiosum]
MQDRPERNTEVPQENAGAAAREWPDEDAFAPGRPARAHHPRHDQDPPRYQAPPEARGALAGLVARHPDVLAKALAHSQSDPELVASARRHRDGSPDPLGAAVLLEVLAANTPHHQREVLRLVAAEWVVDHGVGFAAQAVVELAEVSAERVERSLEGQLRVVRQRAPGRFSFYWHGLQCATEVRRALAPLGDEEHARVVALLDGVRSRGPKAGVLAAFLAPTETGWLDELLAAGVAQRADTVESAMLLSSASTRAQAERVLADAGTWGLHRDHRVAATLLRTLGPEAAGAFIAAFDRADADTTRKLAGYLVAIPTDEALRALVERAEDRRVRPLLQEAVRAYPRRAARLLAESLAGGGKSVDALLRSHLTAFPELADEVLPGLPDDQRAAAEALLVPSGPVLPQAPPELLPEVLTSPPWTRPRPKAPPALTDLAPAGEAALVWKPGEEREWAAESDRNVPYHRTVDWDQELRRGLQRVGTISYMTLLHAPEEVALPLLGAFVPKHNWNIHSWGRALLARFGLRALDRLLLAPVNADVLRVFAPVLDQRVADLMADALGKKKLRWQGLAWLARHGAAALPFLLPAALGKAGRARGAARDAVAVVAEAEGRDVVVETARAHWGDRAAEVTALVLRIDPLTVLPSKLPAHPAWLDVATLPGIRVRGHELALPSGSAADVVTMLMLCSAGEPYAGLAQVREACDGRSLAEFGWEVFDRWRQAALPPKDGWALAALGAVGDDEVVRRLSPLVRAWPGEGGHTRAVAGLDVLADIGTDVALTHLNGIADKARFAGLKKRAREKIAQVADKLDLTPEQLADRVVPHFDLSGSEALVLDYGPRRFLVGFDEQLRPTVADEDGARRKALPKPGAKDDAELAQAAWARFAALKKDLRVIAGDQVRRLERAMVGGRAWGADEFTRFLVGHPVLVHLVRRLVWVAVDGQATRSFRVAEDNTLSGPADEPFELVDGEHVLVAHPLRLGGDLAAWSELFADYEILQPFPQLSRPAHRLSEEERADTRLRRFEGAKLPVREVLSLLSRGWQRTEPLDGGVEPGLVKPVPGGRYAVVTLDPGLVAGDLDAIGDEQELSEVFLSDEAHGYRWGRERQLGLGELDVISASELVEDFVALTGRTGG